MVIIENHHCTHIDRQGRTPRAELETTATILRKLHSDNIAAHIVKCRNTQKAGCGDNGFEVRECVDNAGRPMESGTRKHEKYNTQHDEVWSLPESMSAGYDTELVKGKSA